jgi:hypothetical protein
LHGQIVSYPQVSYSVRALSRLFAVTGTVAASKQKINTMYFIAAPAIFYWSVGRWMPKKGDENCCLEALSKLWSQENRLETANLPDSGPFS